MNDVKISNIPHMAVGEMVAELSNAYSKIINNKLAIKTMPSVMLWGLPGVPREYEQWNLDWFLYSIKLNLPRLEWLELEMPGHTFNPKTLHSLKLRHLSVTSKPFYLSKEDADKN